MFIAAGDPGQQQKQDRRIPGQVAPSRAFPGSVAGGRQDVAILRACRGSGTGKRGAAPGSGGINSALNRPVRRLGYLGLLHPNPGCNKTTWSLSVPGCVRREVPSACTDSLSSCRF